LNLDTQDWGLDHGTWSVLKPMFPAADIPVLQLSLDYSRPPAEHYALGQQLRTLRERGVLVVGSGNIVHNLRAMRRSAGNDQAYDWALDFDQRMGDHIAQGRLDALADFLQLGELARLAHPTHDHFLPLLHAAGAVQASDTPRFFNDKFQGASISMRSIVWS
jgi:4,5-DOPA dioxygenase extradiol